MKKLFIILLLGTFVVGTIFAEDYFTAEISNGLILDYASFNSEKDFIQNYKTALENLTGLSFMDCSNIEGVSKKCGWVDNTEGLSNVIKREMTSNSYKYTVTFEFLYGDVWRFIINKKSGDKYFIKQFSVDFDSNTYMDLMN